MVDINLLKYELLKQNMNISTLAEKIGMSQTSMYNRIRAKGETFTVKEVRSIQKALNLDNEICINIFFTE